jgi:hypothetical protein
LIGSAVIFVPWQRLVSLMPPLARATRADLFRIALTPLGTGKPADLKAGVGKWSGAEDALYLPVVLYRLGEAQFQDFGAVWLLRHHASPLYSMYCSSIAA